MQGYKNILNLASKLFPLNSEKTIAFPTLSTESCFSQRKIDAGIPRYLGAQAAVEAIKEFLEDISNKNKYDSIFLVIKRQDDFIIYKSIMSEKLQKILS